MLRMVNFISGSGTTNQVILEAEKPGGILHRKVRTLAIVSSDPHAAGIQRAIDEGFSRNDIRIADSSEGSLALQLLEILDFYQPDYFHQLGWMPHTPSRVLEEYAGLNQHLGPGGKGMFGLRRIYAHQRFCVMVGESRPIPIFCQNVARQYDAGRVILLRYQDIALDRLSEEVAVELLEVEHEVQICALHRLATGRHHNLPVPILARNPAEQEILDQAIKEACQKYP